MSKAETRQLMLMMQQQYYEDKRYDFLDLGKGGQYTEAQKHFAFELIDEYRIPKRMHKCAHFDLKKLSLFWPNTPSTNG